MNKRVWTFQYKREVDAKGDKASWYVGWYDADGKRHAESCGPGARGRKAAERRKRQLEGQLEAGTYRANGRATWADFRAEYEAGLSGHAPDSCREVRVALDHFERIVRPGKVASIRTEALDKFVKVRLTEKGQKPGSTISPATVNKDLRHIKAALRHAHDRDLLPKLPKVKMVKEPAKQKPYVTPEDFATVYHEACPLAEKPRSRGQNYTPAEWWRALLVFAYMTGWRIGAMLALRWEDVDLERGAAFSRHADNKGKRDTWSPLHPAVVSHLEPLRGFHPLVFRWPHDERTLWAEFARIQAAAGIRLVCREDHEHTEACFTYGFHALRRACATMNADRLTGDALQALMQHRSYLTTQRYINMARQLNQTAEALYVPDVLKARQA